MRIRRGMPEIKEGNVNVTPLIDIVMCLIIFFMLVAKIGVDTGADRRITIPESLQGLDIGDMGNTLTLNVQPGGGSRTGLKVGGWIMVGLGGLFVLAAIAAIVVHLTQRDKNGYYTSSTVQVASRAVARARPSRISRRCCTTEWLASR